jgi:hypothetical protein
MPIACSVRTDHRDERSAECPRASAAAVKGNGGRLGRAVRALRAR